MYLRVIDKEGYVVDPTYTGELDVFTVIIMEVKDEPPKKADSAYIPEKNKTGGIIGYPIIPPSSPSPPAPEEEEIMIPEDLKLPHNC